MFRAATGGQMLDEQRMEMERLKSRLIESEARARHLESMLDTRDRDIGKCPSERGGVEGVGRTAGDGAAVPWRGRSSEEELRSTYGSHIAMMEAILDTKAPRFIPAFTYPRFTNASILRIARFYEPFLITYRNAAKLVYFFIFIFTFYLLSISLLFKDIGDEQNRGKK
ncbi:hypothetical protein HPB48_008635 [Haemaphysalis longicornis]|uniref:Uncharacterized protein n=1 Tax=Haemaphysalis longicornis TaxID=44386 RepID=A0A9J6H5Q4_HAELO|nr:hypothetical protein HPB48_008635 [Haemaphysalis longicornis]